jgi:hypothetical protein
MQEDLELYFEIFSLPTAPSRGIINAIKSSSLNFINKFQENGQASTPIRDILKAKNGSPHQHPPEVATSDHSS